jgi:hypothetical protein
MTRLAAAIQVAHAHAGELPKVQAGSWHAETEYVSDMTTIGLPLTVTRG